MTPLRMTSHTHPLQDITLDASIYILSNIANSGNSAQWCIMGYHDTLGTVPG